MESHVGFHVTLTTLLCTESWISKKIYLRGWGYDVFNATFNNISFISWLSVLFVEETRVHREISPFYKTNSNKLESND